MPLSWTSRAPERPTLGLSRPPGPPGAPAVPFWSPAAHFSARSSPGERATGPRRAPFDPPRRDLSVEPSADPRRPCVPEIPSLLRPKGADLQAQRSSGEARGVREPPRLPKRVRGPSVDPLLPSGWHQFAGKGERKKDTGQWGTLPRSWDLQEADRPALGALWPRWVPLPGCRAPRVGPSAAGGLTFLPLLHFATGRGELDPGPPGPRHFEKFLAPEGLPGGRLSDRPWPGTETLSGLGSAEVPWPPYLRDGGGLPAAVDRSPCPAGGGDAAPGLRGRTPPGGRSGYCSARRRSAIFGAKTVCQI